VDPADVATAEIEALEEAEDIRVLVLRWLSAPRVPLSGVLAEYMVIVVELQDAARSTATFDSDVALPGAHLAVMEQSSSTRILSKPTGPASMVCTMIITQRVASPTNRVLHSSVWIKFDCD
jgi:hypothetical protein